LSPSSTQSGPQGSIFSQSNQPQPSSIFSAPSSSIFNQPLASPQQQTPQGSVFSQPTPSLAGGGGGSIFNTGGGGSVFNTGSQSVFSGASTPQAGQPTSSSIFNLGGGGASAPQPASSGSVFNMGGGGGGSIFSGGGGPSIFSQPQQTQSSQPFSTPIGGMTGGLGGGLGISTIAPQGVSFPTGPITVTNRPSNETQANVSEEDLNAFKAATFTFGRIPEVEPPAHVC